MKAKGGTSITVMEVVWQDAHSQDAWTAETEVLLDTEPYLVTSVGMLVKSDKSQVCICIARSNTGDISGLLCIPRGVVKRTRVIGRTKVAT